CTRSPRCVRNGRAVSSGSDVAAGGNAHFMLSGRVDYEPRLSRPGALHDRDLAPTGFLIAPVAPGCPRPLPHARGRMRGRWVVNWHQRHAWASTTPHSTTMAAI